MNTIILFSINYVFCGIFSIRKDTRFDVIMQHLFAC